VAHYNLGLLLGDSGKNDEAISHFEQAVHLAPNVADIQNKFGILLQKNGRDKEAIEHYQAALRVEPNSAGVYANLAQALAAVGRTEEALETARKGIAAARATGNQKVIQQVEEAMNDLQAELKRGGKATPSSQTGPSAHEQK
jgi:protein O-mannosyl-transferase